MKVVIAESPEFSKRGLELLAAHGLSTDLFTGDLKDLPGALHGADGAIVRFGLHWDRLHLSQAAHLKFLAVPATGTDHIDREAAAENGIDVLSLARNPGLREITATPEHCFGLMLSLLRKTVSAHRSVLEGRWDRDAFFGNQLRGKTIGIVGMGRTGSAFAVMSQAFGMNVVYFDPYVDSDRGRRCTDLRDLADASEVIAVHAVLSDETHGLLGEDFFSWVRPGAFLINTARGGIVDEGALIGALSDGRLAGAALDVIQNEPEKGAAVNSALVDYARANDNLILTPHIGGATRESIEMAEYLIAEAVVDHTLKRRSV